MILNAYMGYSRLGTPQEGAVLVFAKSARQARVLTFYSVIGGESCDRKWTDVAVRRLRDSPWLDKERRGDEPHVIESPRCCCRCEMWGHTEIGPDGRCEECREPDEGIDEVQS